MAQAIMLLAQERIEPFGMFGNIPAQPVDSAGDGGRSGKLAQSLKTWLKRSLAAEEIRQA